MRLALLNDCLALMEHTAYLADKVPKKWRLWLAEPLSRELGGVCHNLAFANQENLKIREGRARRIRLQNQALAGLTVADNLMALAVQMKALSPKQLDSWSKKLSGLRARILGWIKSDLEQIEKMTH